MVLIFVLIELGGCSLSFEFLLEFFLSSGCDGLLGDLNFWKVGGVLFFIIKFVGGLL